VAQRELLRDTESSGFRRFEVEAPNILCQSDAQHTLYLPDPRDPKKRKKAILFAILDDYSRLVIHGQFYWDEKLPRLENCLKKAVLRHGLPEQFYCDNGHLVRICGKLGIRLSHSRPYRPAGRVFYVGDV
jgi:putative transposase